MTIEGSDPKNPGPGVQTEVEVMKVIGEALDGLSDLEARSRVLAWAASRFGSALPTRQLVLSGAGEHLTGFGIASRDKEIPGVARLSENGTLEVTVRDLKAKSTLDAAIRLGLIAIRANEILTGSASLSSRKALVPILKDWRAYDGNTRPALARHKGILRNGDNLSLDAIAKKEAEKYIAEVLDDSISGNWNPDARRAKRAASKTAAG